MTDMPDTNDTSRQPTSHRWGNGWTLHNRNDIINLMDDGTINYPDDYDHFDSFEDMAAFILSRGPYLNNTGFHPTQQDYTQINPNAPTNLDWNELQDTYDCLTTPD